MFGRTLIGFATIVVASTASAAPASIAKLEGARRVLIVSAPDEADPSLGKQRDTIGKWRSGAQERDVTVVQIAGDSVEGADEKAADLRKSYDLPASRFAVVLIGKDGHVALRSGTPIMSGDLARRIDAMPMRRAGER